VDYVREKTDPEWKPPASPVIVLTSENFTKTVRDVDIMLVEFYAPWCKHCQQVRPVDLINIFSVLERCHSHGTSDMFHSLKSFNF
jgi:thioredoxin-like negative regulator of GroEL